MMVDNTKGDILVVDDEPNAVKVLSSILSQEGYRVWGSNDTDSATHLIHSSNIDAVITDVRMPGKDGMEFFGYVKENRPDIPVIFLSAYGTVESAITAIQQGAYHYFTKPPDYVQLKATLSKAVNASRMRRDSFAEEIFIGEHSRCLIVGRTARMLEIMKTMEVVRDSKSSVLICGETGTGKELIAKGLHFKSVRRAKPFVAVNCAAIPKELMESELFGHEKGAFTGAFSRRIGRFEEACGGTLFLDEIGELDPALQTKLLRVLQEKEIVRLGSNKTIKVDFRLVCSTNRDLPKEIEQKTFREDLFYRINVLVIQLPPLRERRGDIPLLVDEFLKECGGRENKMVGASEEVMDAFYEYSWPGNIRQLRNVIERAVVLTKGNTITLSEIPEDLRRGKRIEISVMDSTETTLKEIKLKAVRDALQKYNGNKSKAAKVLGISRKALYKRLKCANARF